MRISASTITIPELMIPDCYVAARAYDYDDDDYGYNGDALADDDYDGSDKHSHDDDIGRYHDAALLYRNADEYTTS